MGKKKKLSSFSDLGGMVYSTDPDYVPEIEDEEVEEIPPSQQTLYVSYDKKQRKGKVVTLVEGFEGSEEAMNKLGKELKSKCGAGGSVKDGQIIIQGNFVQKVLDHLSNLGFQVKKKGG